MNEAITKSPSLTLRDVLDFVRRHEGARLETLTEKVPYWVRSSGVGGVGFDKQDGIHDETIKPKDLKRCVDIFNRLSEDERQRPSSYRYPSSPWVASYVAQLLLTAAKAKKGSSGSDVDGRTEGREEVRVSWSAEEAEATVADYFVMLKEELRGIPFNKAAHRKELLRRLNKRSPGSVERKHGNISAILLELGHPWIDGYKPFGNYQDLLREVVQHELERDQELEELVEARVDSTVDADPKIMDILSTVVAAPEIRTPQTGLRKSNVKVPGGSIDYLAREARNQDLGLAGERFVLEYERKRLIASGLERFADKIEHVAITVGNGEGFDIRSFESNGSDRLIEVKTTGFSIETPFYVTPKELRVSQEMKTRYFLYRLFKFRTDPRQYQVSGAIDTSFRMAAALYQARR